MILMCVCQHEYQNKLYGIGKRVHNPCKHGTAARCTVCKAEKPLTKEQTKKLNAEDE